MSDARITIRLKCPNPLFEKWLTEWRDIEQAKNTKKQHCYRRALETLKKYPLPLSSGKECIILEGFGAKLCKMLDDKLSQCNRPIAQVDITNTNFNKTRTKVDDTDVTPRKQAKKDTDLQKPKRNKEYVPTTRSGGYAILLALYKDSIDENSLGQLTKAELIERAQEYCDTSFIKSDPGSFYNAWSSMSLLITKKLVEKEGNPPKFSLTDSGIELGHRLYLSSLNEKSIYETNDISDNYSGEVKGNDGRGSVGYPSTTTSKSFGDNSNNKRGNQECEVSSTSSFGSEFTIKPSFGRNLSGTSITSAAVTKNTFSRNPSANLITTNVGNKKAFGRNPSTASVSSEASATDTENLIFAPKSFDIILLVDTQETSGVGKKVTEDQTKLELNSLKVVYEIRHLKIGDYTWICREKNSKKELVLPYVVERKRIDDLGASIKDGRFHEQKFRLKQCGIQNLIYLVESYGGNKHTRLPLTSLQQAATNTLIQDEFSVKFTPDFKSSMKYLAIFTTILNNIFKNKTLISCPKADLMKSTPDDDLVPLMTFNEFNKTASKQKQFKVRELFVKQLLQLKGVSVEKALAIVEVYPTPRRLKEKYKKCSEKEGENLLSGVQFGKLQKKIGVSVSKTIYQLYTIKK